MAGMCSTMLHFVEEVPSHLAQENSRRALEDRSHQSQAFQCFIAASNLIDVYCPSGSCFANTGVAEWPTQISHKHHLHPAPTSMMHHFSRMNKAPLASPEHKRNRQKRLRPRVSAEHTHTHTQRAVRTRHPNRSARRLLWAPCCMPLTSSIRLFTCCPRHTVAAW